MSELAVEKSSLQNADIPQPFSECGLSVNPFDDSANQRDISSPHLSADENPFFMGGDRRSVLDEVIHLSQFSHHLVSVLGEAGVGKTALVCQAVLELQETAQCCVLQSSVMLTVEEVLEQLISQLGLFVSDGASVDEMIAVVHQYQPVGLQQRVVIVVDDAHHLNSAVLALFVRLLQEQSTGYLHVLLVGDSSLLLRLDELDKGEVLVYDIPLCPFSVDELEYYLSFKLAAVGYQGAELFDYDMLSTIWRETRGIPASVNRAANTLLMNRVAVEDEGTRLGLPIAYMAILVVLLAALIMALFYMDDEPLPQQSEPDALLSESGVSDESGKALITNEPSVVLEGATVFLPKPNQESTGGQPVDVTAVSEESIAIAPASAPVPLQENALQGDAVTEKPPVLAIDDSVNDEPVSSIENVSEPVANVVPSPADVQSSSALVAPKESVVSRQLTVDEEAVLFWPKESYTLQVMAAGQLSGVKRFVSAQPNSRLLRIVRFERNGAPWYSVLVGVYDDVASARQAIAALPKSQSSAKPWPRKISDVQQNIESFRRR